MYFHQDQVSLCYGLDSQEEGAGPSGDIKVQTQNWQCPDLVKRLQLTRRKF
jgi:hypothetical protein